MKTSADEGSSTTTGYVADVSQHHATTTTATTTHCEDDDESMDDAKPEAGDENSTSLLLLQGIFGKAARPAASAATASPIVGSKECGDETKDAKDEGEDHQPASAAESTATFVNHGLAVWEKNREKWLERATGESKTAKHAKPLNVDLIIDAIFTTPQKLRVNGGISEKFPQSVPLPQLVDILQDLWEAESL